MECSDYLSGKFTLFLANGTPVRATLTVTFKEFIDVDQLVRRAPRIRRPQKKTGGQERRSHRHYCE